MSVEVQILPRKTKLVNKINVQFEKQQVKKDMQMLCKRRKIVES